VDRTRLTFSNQLNALQLVKKKAQAAIPLVFDFNDGDPNVFVAASPYDRAGDFNNRVEGNGDRDDNVYGPTINNFNDANFPEWYDQPQFTAFDHWEFAEYDVEVIDAGQYSISPVVSTRGESFDAMGITVNGKVVGRATDVVSQLMPDEPIPANRALVNLFPGEYRIGWRILRLAGSVHTGYSILGLRVRIVEDPQIDDCLDVLSSEFNYLGDLNRDCVVDEDDLAVFVDQWLSSNDPN